jgi:hypothetical protein
MSLAYLANDLQLVSEGRFVYAPDTALLTELLAALKI